MHPQKKYIPAVAMTTCSGLKQSCCRIPVATTAAPDRVCGEARRIGYTGILDSDLPLYRLKIKVGNGLLTVTLPGFYIIEGGVFVEYEQWRREQGGGKGTFI